MKITPQAIISVIGLVTGVAILIMMVLSFKGDDKKSDNDNKK